MLADISDALGFNPWGDDDSPYRVLTNHIVLTAVSHDCAICFQRIPARSTVRAQSEVLDGKAKTFYFCRVCCKAMMTARRTGNIEPLERRTQIGMRVALVPAGTKE